MTQQFNRDSVWMTCQRCNYTYMSSEVSNSRICPSCRADMTSRYDTEAEIMHELNRPRAERDLQ